MSDATIPEWPRCPSCGSRDYDLSFDNWKRAACDCGAEFDIPDAVPVRALQKATLAGLAAVEKTRISARIRALPGCTETEQPGGEPFNTDLPTCYQEVQAGDMPRDEVCGNCARLMELLPEQKAASRKLSNAVRRYRRAIGEVS